MKIRYVLKNKNRKEIYKGDKLRVVNHIDNGDPVYLHHYVVWRDILNGWFCLNVNDETESLSDGSCQL